MATVESLSAKVQSLIDGCKAVTSYAIVEPKKALFTSSATELTSGTSLSASVECNIGDLIICAIATRDTLTVSSGWTLVSTSGINSADTTNGQRLSWAYKYAESTTETITVTQASAQRLYINMVALTGATGITDNGYSYRDDTTCGTMTVAKPNGLVLWGATTPLWDSSSPYNLWTVSNDSSIVQLGSSTQSRLAIILDQSEDEEVTFNANSNTTMIVGSLIIEGMDSFYIPPVYGDTINDLTGQIAILSGLTGGVDEGLSVKAKLQNLISACQPVTGDSSNDLTMQVCLLIYPKPGLYDTNHMWVASWDTLVNTYGMNVETNYTDSTCKTAATSPYKVLSQSALSSGVKLVFGDDVTTIGRYAFYQNKQLKSITIPDSVTFIGNNAFCACTSLTDVTFGENSQLTTIDGNAFRSCTNLKNIAIPDSVTTIGEYAFYDMGLVNITFGENSQLTTIGPQAFSSCQSLVSITIPESVTSIDSNAFSYCYKLNIINYEGTVAQWNAITKGNWNDGVPATEVVCSDGTVSLS